MSQRELEQRVRNILIKQSDNGAAMGGSCCHHCNGSGLVITADQRYGAALVGGAFSWKGMLDMIGELAQIVGDLFSNFPSSDSKAESACRRRLRQEGITDKKSFNQWAKRNHPDRVSASDKRRATALFQDIRNCLNSEGLGRGYVGGVRKGEKLPEELKNKLKAGQSAYLAFMKERKAQGMKHKDALVEWKEYKKTRSSAPIPKPRTMKPTQSECERFYGSMGMPVQGQNANDPSLMDEIQDQIIEVLEQNPEPDWSGQEQLREALDYTPADELPPPPDWMLYTPADELPPPPDWMLYTPADELPSPPDDDDDDDEDFRPSGITQEESDLIDYRGYYGEGRPKGSKNKKPRKDKGIKRPVSEGLKKYQDFIKCMKNSGLTHKEAVQMYKDMKAKHGGNWFDSFKKGFMMPFEAVAKLAPLAPLLL